MLYTGIFKKMRPEKISTYFLSTTVFITIFTKIEITNLNKHYSSYEQFLSDITLMFL